MLLANIACCVATCSLLCVHVASPSAELVKRVRELYTRNSSDVRFLIPVLHGLQKVCSLSHIKRLVCHLPLLKNLAPTARVIVGRKEAYCWSLDRYKDTSQCSAYFPCSKRSYQLCPSLSNSVQAW